ncbi:MAG TPA: glycoside hydrolase family 3 C-terminal domain-containing protein [Candidatus Onthovicinus excrementipullorum]|nr:glycoside hydrolase family 3 C-terminal domain-containing protein [Candidatus Onthovicinus excrementipullorum]
MQKLLRGHWGFQGYYVSDCGALIDIVFHHKLTRNPLKGAAMALNTGCDLECGALYRLLPLACLFGYVKKETLRNAVARLMMIRSELGMFDPDCAYNRIDPKENATAENEAFAVRVAEKGIVLLENDGTLPLKKNAQKILVTGYNAENEIAYLGNYFGEPSSYVKVFEAVREKNAQTQHVGGVLLWQRADPVQREAALQAARESDVILFCTGLDASIEGEAGGEAFANAGNLGKQGDRPDLELPQVQREFLDDLAALGKKLILLNFSGGCVNLKKYCDRANAILQCWYPGGKGGQAIANILFGEVSPSGKLPITFYNSVDDLPPFEDYSMENRTYKYFRGAVQYPFGYGLTYTDFRLENAQLDMQQERLTVTVHNTGAFDSDEVLQIYVTPPARDYRTPAKALVRVRRFHLKCDGSQTVEIPLPESVLYTIDGEGNKVYTKGEYCIRIEDGQSIDQVLTFRNGAEDRIVERCPI